MAIVWAGLVPDSFMECVIDLWGPGGAIYIVHFTYFASVHVFAFATYPILYWSGTVSYVAWCMQVAQPELAGAFPKTYGTVRYGTVPYPTIYGTVPYRSWNAAEWLLFRLQHYLFRLRGFDNVRNER